MTEMRFAKIMFQVTIKVEIFRSKGGAICWMAQNVRGVQAIHLEEFAMRSLGTHRKHNFPKFRSQFCTIPTNIQETWGNFIDRVVIMKLLFTNFRFYCKHQILCDGQPECSLTWTFSWPPWNSLTHFLHFIFSQCFSTKKFSYLVLRIFTADMFIAVKKRITDHISHTVYDSIILSIWNTRTEGYAVSTELKLRRICGVFTKGKDAGKRLSLVVRGAAWLVAACFEHGSYTRQWTLLQKLPSYCNLFYRQNIYLNVQVSSIASKYILLEIFLVGKC